MWSFLIQIAIRSLLAVTCQEEIPLSPLSTVFVFPTKNHFFYLFFSYIFNLSCPYRLIYPRPCCCSSLLLAREIYLADLSFCATMCKCGHMILGVAGERGGYLSRVTRARPHTSSQDLEYLHFPFSIPTNGAPKQTSSLVSSR